MEKRDLNISRRKHWIKYEIDADVPSGIFIWLMIVVAIYVAAALYFLFAGKGGV